MHPQGSNRLEAGRPVGRVGGHWEPSAGINSSLYACTKPIKKDLYVHNGVRAVTRAAVFSCICTRSWGGQLATTLLQKADSTPSYLGGKGPVRSWPSVFTRPALPGQKIRRKGRRVTSLGC